MRPAHRVFLVAATIGCVLTATARVGHVQTPSGFAARLAQLSEPGGYFDTDNLISNEKSYLHVVPSLREARLDGGAYIGVGPDQNFSYIAQTRPSIAFIVDIRRDNLLLHLLFKALFQLSTTRVDYLSLLIGRPPPARLDGWTGADIEKIVEYLDGATVVPAEEVAALRARVTSTIHGYGVPLSPLDLSTIDRFHRTFIEHGLSLKFESTGRTPRSYYPTLRELLLETDRKGQKWSYAASESDFQFVRGLEQRDLVVPVVGNLAGPTALVNIGRLMDERGDRLGAFYASNVEFYLSNDGTFPIFITNLAKLPHTNRSLIIRSVFAGGASASVRPEPGYFSVSMVQGVDALLEGVAGKTIRGYRDLIQSGRP